MKKPEPDDLSNLSMLELFRVEADTQTAILTSGLLELERLMVDSAVLTPGNQPSTLNPQPATLLESLMRAAHSLKGAARIVNLPAAVQMAHAMEECFVAAQARSRECEAGRCGREAGRCEVGQLGCLLRAQHGQVALRQEQTDVLLRGVDLLAGISKDDVAKKENDDDVQTFLNALAALKTATRSETSAPPAGGSGVGSPVVSSPEATDRVLRLTAKNLNRLLGLAGESLVESRWLRPFSEAMQRLKRMQSDVERTLEALRQSAESESLSEQSRGRINELFGQTAEARQYLADRLQELDLYDRRSAHLSNRLYLEVLRARMRPFGDGVSRFPRMVRDLARSLGKEVKLEIVGENTQVDRDILERLEAPLNHLLRNAVDHGCETPGERERAGKPPEATIRLEARHSAGMLLVAVSDDGAGVDPGRVRHLIADKKLTTPAIAEKMNESELLQFLFLPGFSLRDTVTEISGRGVGLDIVQNMVKSVRGNVRVNSQPGCGMRFQLQLPLTLSVLRTLLVEVGGEPYAIPLAQIVSTLKLARERIESLEGRHHFNLGKEQIGLLAAHQILDCQELNPPETDLPIVVLGDRNTRYGLVVDRFLGERELVVQPLDPRLGKVKDISAAALMEDGAPVLIVDVDDLVRSIEKLIATGALANVSRSGLEPAARKRKRVLAVDDSLTVRELERKLLINRGYVADVAVDGMDGWNAVRTGVYDLVITDVDMPRMDGIELATLIKRDPHLKSLPVMIVSYKDREEDRLRGLEAGADYYLTKGSFHDETLLQAVQDLIGEPEA